MRYTRTHEWVLLEKSGMITVGISNRSQEMFGEIVFIELPEKGEEFEQDELLGSIESIDGEVIHIHSPITGEVIEVNLTLENTPDLINRSPEGDGWIVKMRMEFPKEYNTLMTPAEYEEYEEESVEEDEIEEEEEEEDYF